MPRSWPPEPGPPGGAERARRVYHGRGASPGAPHVSCVHPPPTPRDPASVPSSTILVLETIPGAAATGEGPLSSVGYQVTVTADPDDALRRAADFALVIVDVGPGPRSGADRSEEHTSELQSRPYLVC